MCWSFLYKVNYISLILKIQNTFKINSKYFDESKHNNQGQPVEICQIDEDSNDDQVDGTFNFKKYKFKPNYPNANIEDKPKSPPPVRKPNVKVFKTKKSKYPRPAYSYTCLTALGMVSHKISIVTIFGHAYYFKN